VPGPDPGASVDAAPYEQDEIPARGQRQHEGPAHRTAPEPTVVRIPFPVNKPVFTAEAGSDSISLSDPGSRTAIYDIAAHIVYLPNGDAGSAFRARQRFGQS
jgi:hypothetical protein